MISIKKIRGRVKAAKRPSFSGRKALGAGLGRIRAQVEKQRASIISKLKRLRREDPFMTVDRSLIVEPGTDAAALFGHEQIVVLEQRLKGDLKELEKALEKLKKGTYGICERCGRRIDEKRLVAKPSAVYCLKCESEVERKRK